jgi:hypothetical protein
MSLRAKTRGQTTISSRQAGRPRLPHVEGANMQQIDFIATIAGAVTASITPVVLAAETFRPARSGWLANFHLIVSRLSRRLRRGIGQWIAAAIPTPQRGTSRAAFRRRRDSRHKGISIYRLNVINDRRPGDLDLIRDQARIDDRHRLCELAHNTNSATRLLRVFLRHELPR